MDVTLFSVSLLIAIVGPIVAISYLKPILSEVLGSLCDNRSGAEFWIRSAYLLAVSGTLLLMLAFGRFDEGANLVETVRRSLALVFGGVFVSVALISRNVWRQVKEMLALREVTAVPQLRTAADAEGA